MMQHTHTHKIKQAENTVTEKEDYHPLDFTWVLGMQTEDPMFLQQASYLLSRPLRP